MGRCWNSLWPDCGRCRSKTTHLVIVEIDSPGGLVSLVSTSPIGCGTPMGGDGGVCAAQVVSGAAIVALGASRSSWIPTPSGRRGRSSWAKILFATRRKKCVAIWLARSAIWPSGQTSAALAEAMVDMNLVVYEVTDRQTGAKVHVGARTQVVAKPGSMGKGSPGAGVTPGQFLEVNSRRAVELTLAEGNANSRQQLQQRLGLTEPPQVIKPPAWTPPSTF